jgi:hypothetical protein
MTGLRLATGLLFPAPFFTSAPWPAVTAPGDCSNFYLPGIFDKNTLFEASF